MGTHELIKNLLIKPKEEIEFALVSLLLEGKIDFTTISTSYIHYLNLIKEDRANQLTEAGTCILESLIYNIDDDIKESKNSI